MALENHYAGHYNVGYNGVDIGSSESGFTLSLSPSMIPVRDDLNGSTVIDVLFTGMELGMVRIEALQFNVDNLASAMPWLCSSAGPGLTSDDYGEFGEIQHNPGTLLHAAHMKTLVLTNVVAGGEEYMFTKAFPMEPISMLFSSTRLRRVPFGFGVFVSDSSQKQLFTLS